MFVKSYQFVSSVCFILTERKLCLTRNSSKLNKQTASSHFYCFFPLSQSSLVLGAGFSKLKYRLKRQCTLVCNLVVLSLSVTKPKQANVLRACSDLFRRNRREQCCPLFRKDFQMVINMVFHKEKADVAKFRKRSNKYQ